MNKNANTEDFVANPFTGEQDEPAAQYPLTIEELKAVARHWWEKYIDIWLFCRMYNSTGSTDLRCSEYATCRLLRIEAILGQEDYKKTYTEVTEIFRSRFGDAVWQAYLDRKPIFGEDATDEEKAFYEREMAKVGWVVERTNGDK